MEVVLKMGPPRHKRHAGLKYVYNVKIMMIKDIIREIVR
jgi:hypothetical protein